MLPRSCGLRDLIVLRWNAGRGSSTTSIPKFARKSGASRSSKRSTTATQSMGINGSCCKNTYLVGNLALETELKQKLKTISTATSGSCLKLLVDFALKPAVASSATFGLMLCWRFTMVKAVGIIANRFPGRYSGQTNPRGLALSGQSKELRVDDREQPWGLYGT